MKKCILVILVLSGIAVAQLFRGDPVDAERARLREKLTRLAEARKDLAVPQPQPALPIVPAIDQPASKDLLPVAEGKKMPAQPVAQQRAAQVVAVEKSPTPAPQPTVAGPGKPAPAATAATDEAISSPATDEFQGVNGKQEVSLGEIARQNRARKRQQPSSSH
jgi:hypothetical protein